VLIDPIIPGAGALFEVPIPVPLDGYPIEYGRAIEYEQQTSITTKITNTNLVSFMVFPSIVLLQVSYIYALSKKIFIFPYSCLFFPLFVLIWVTAKNLLFVSHLYLICTFYYANMFFCYCFPAKLLNLARGIGTSWQESLNS
jgi:hypothetical protein